MWMKKAYILRGQHHKNGQIIPEGEIIGISSVSKCPHITNVLGFESRCGVKFHLYVFSNSNMLILWLPHEYPTLVLEPMVRWNDPCIKSLSKNDDQVRCHVDGRVSVCDKNKIPV
ncbi:hypothetical protein MtrunA17_Chr1g0188831 [Medicago truncatula]|uniref:Uncharacterized protein n=1 Tax=Medicago truncatula TaxID=3880 RepID=A0A396JQC1_MEDTR|nr:hypothetical protein MtrunA17_Chr1g0188831 [Medicago truncatula]